MWLFVNIHMLGSGQMTEGMPAPSGVLSQLSHRTGAVSKVQFLRGARTATISGVVLQLLPERAAVSQVHLLRVARRALISVCRVLRCASALR